jgi:hypothetical protein
MRGFGYIKQRNVAAAREKQERLLERWRAPRAERVAA